MHFPDPLFGSSINDPNAMPSDFAREKLSPHQHVESFRPSRHYSFASAPDSQGEPLPGSSSDQRAFHQSLPDIQYRSSEGKDPFDDELAHMHQSMPDITASAKGAFPDDEDKKIPARDIEPIPLHHIKIPSRLKSKSKLPEVPIKKEASMEDIPSSSSSGRSGSGRISKDLMECLDKMTYHSIADDKLFEPIPLSPQADKAYASSSQKPAKAAAAELFEQPMDESSERDEFAEG